VEGLPHRYFVAIIGFGFVACWSAAGILTALSALATCIGLVVAPSLVSPASRDRRRHARRRHSRGALRARPLAREGDDPLPLVPDEPSLVLELTGRG
jgi:hypothetical protein